MVIEYLKAIKEKNLTNYVIMARGTSDNAATVFTTLFPLKTGKIISPFYLSTYTVYNSKLDLNGTLFIIVSQSGMSKDTVKVMRDAKRDGAVVVGVTNNIESPVAKEADFHLFLDVDEEKSVAATKTYIAELFALEMLAEAVGGTIETSYEDVAKEIEKILALSDTEINAVAKGIVNSDNYLILSRGTTLGSADELCLKLTECCYLFAKSFSSATFMHGPLSLLSTGANLILLAPDSEFTQEYIDMAKRAKDKGATLIAFSDIDEVLSFADYKVRMPKSNRITRALQSFDFVRGISTFKYHTLEREACGSSIWRIRLKIVVLYIGPAEPFTSYHKQPLFLFRRNQLSAMKRTCFQTTK